MSSKLDKNREFSLLRSVRFGSIRFDEFERSAKNKEFDLFRSGSIKPNFIRFFQFKVPRKFGSHCINFIQKKKK